VVFETHLKALSTPLKKVRLLVIRSSSIGDVVLATSVVTTVFQWEKLYGIEVDLHWAGQEPSLSLIREFLPRVTTHKITNLESLPQDLTGCLDLQGNIRSFKLTRHLGKHKGTMVVRSTKNYFYRSALIAFSRILGRSRLSSRAAAVLASIVGESAGKRQSDLAADAMGCLLKNIFPYPPPPKADARPQLICTTKSPLLDPVFRWIAVAPGAAHPNKKAPATLFLDTLTEISRSMSTTNALKTGLVLLGASSEKADCAKLHEILQRHSNSAGKAWAGPILDLSGQTDLQGTVPILNSCSALLGNDSSLGHIAESLGKPAFIFFGPTVEAFGFAPGLMHSKAYSVSLGCRPCSKHGKTSCRYGDQLCFAGIPYQLVANDVATLLSEIP
jgi:ADP-heptose:LPS heptosyltransferase